MKNNYLLYIVVTSKFVLVDAFLSPVTSRTVSSNIAFIGTVDAKGRHITINPQDDFNIVDHDRAKECIENFGECSLQELEQIKSTLHNERFQSLVAGNSVLIQDMGGDFESLFLEEEIDQQLEMLQEHDTSKTTLFPKNNDGKEFTTTTNQIEDKMINIMNSVPHDSTTKSSMFSMPSPSEILAFEESVMDENTMETALICMVMGAIMFLPLFGNHYDFL